MTLYERIKRVETRSPWEDKCLYCGEHDCPHARPWGGAWSSRAPMREVSPVYAATSVVQAISDGVFSHR